jgi:D-ribose pyranase
LKKTDLLNSSISRVVASMGHLDTLAVADAGFPIPSSTERIDLAVGQGIPGFIDTVKAILSELKIEKIILAGEIKVASPEIYSALLTLTEGVAVEFIPHEEFKARISLAKAVVRTGEFSPYANVILVSGVVF